MSQTEMSGSEPLLEACCKCGAELDVTELEPLADATCPQCGAITQARTHLKNYAIEGVLGVGGMGSVFRARDVNLNRQVALKVIRKEFSGDPEHLKKFEEEARITALVNHPNVVKVFSFGSDHEVLFIAMELADKGNLDDLMTRKGRISEAQALEVGIQIAEGLRAAFLRGLIHRDVKPGNILFTDSHMAKIVDFGLACLVEEKAEERGEIWGTPYYVAPEKLRHGPEDFRSDIYSLGGTLFHAIAGQPPHLAETASIVALQQIKSKAVNLQAVAPDVSSATSLVINRMLENDPGKRYQSYGELVEHLTYASNKLSEPASGPGPALPSAFLAAGGRKQILAWAIILLLIVSSGIGLYFFRNRGFKKEDLTYADTGSETAAGSADIGDRYEGARKMILKGESAGAKKLLAELSAKPNLPQPLGRWILLHEGLAGLLSGNADGAREAFRKLQEHGLYSLDPEDKALANFFVETGRLVAEGNPVSLDDTANYNPNGCEALGFFILALDDWQLSHFDEAGPLLRAYLGSDPQAPFDWISDYKPLAKTYAKSFDTYQKITAEIAAADTLQKKKSALENLNALKSPQLLHGKLAAKLQQLQAELEKQIAAGQELEDQKRTAELAEEREQQEKRLREGKVKFAALADAMQFDEALAFAQGMGRFSFPELENDRIVLAKKAEWLVQFKSQLMSDLTVTGYPKPVVKRTGATISGVAHTATKSQIEIQTPYGSVAVQWTEMAPATILAMADYFIQNNGNPAANADRLWVAGVFAIQSGIQNQGLLLLNSAADKNAGYRDQLPIFTEPEKP